MRLEAVPIPKWCFQGEGQPEIGLEAYDRGAEILTEFFHAHVREFLEPDLSPLGRKIIECCLDGGSVADYEQVLPGERALETPREM
jgi:hypothetical protein